MKSWELRRWAMLVGVRFGSITFVVALDRFVVGLWTRLLALVAFRLELDTFSLFRCTVRLVLSGVL